VVKVWGCLFTRAVSIQSNDLETAVGRKIERRTGPLGIAVGAIAVSERLAAGAVAEYRNVRADDGGGQGKQE